MTSYKLGFSLVFSLFVALSCTREDPFQSGRFIDLTHDFSSETIYWPTSEPFQLETVFRGITDKNFFYSAYKFCAAEHGGTHIDAPVHFALGHNSVDKIPLEQLIGPAVVIDVSEHTLNDRDYQISIQDFETWESSNGSIPENVANLERLPPRGAIIIALPMKIKEGSGGPLRIVAFLSGK